MSKTKTEYEQLTGFRPPKSRRNRYVLLLDYGYGPSEWVVAITAQTEERIRAERRKYPQWSSDKVKILDRENEVSR